MLYVVLERVGVKKENGFLYTAKALKEMAKSNSCLRYDKKIKALIYIGDKINQGE